VKGDAGVLPKEAPQSVNNVTFGLRLLAVVYYRCEDHIFKAHNSKTIHPPILGIDMDVNQTNSEARKPVRLKRTSGILVFLDLLYFYIDLNYSSEYTKYTLILYAIAYIILSCD